MANYCVGRWRSSSSIPNSRCPSLSQLQGIDFEQLFGNIQGSTEPAPFVDHVGHLLPDIPQAQSYQYVRPNRSEPPAFVEYIIQRGKETLYKKNLAAKLPSEIEIVTFIVLKGAEKLHWIAVGFSVIAFVLYSIQQRSSTFNKCMLLVHKFLDFAKHLQNLHKGMLSHESEYLNELILAIVEEAITCCCYMSKQYIFWDMFACTNKANPQNFVAVIKKLSRLLMLMIAMDIQRQIAQFYGYGPQALLGAVGIEDKIEEVIPCKAKAQQEQWFYMTSMV